MIFADTDKMKFRIFPPFLVFALVFAFTLSQEPATALDYVRFIHQGKEQNEEGRVTLEETNEFGFESRDGQFYIFMAEPPENVRNRKNIIETKNILSRTSDDIPFAPYSKAEMLERLKVEFPTGEGYYHLDMQPFIVVYTTSSPFANWYGNLLKKLYNDYISYWRQQGVQLTVPEFPLVAIMFSNEARFRQYTQQEGVSLFLEQRAYYHKLANRIVMYDITGQQAFQENVQRRQTVNDAQRFRSQPNNIMNVVHEAVHLVGFNTGMHPRNAPNPVWLYEGLAVLHEVPDTKNPSGWTIGPYVNRPRLDQLRRFLNHPHQESPIQRIQKMLQDDNLFFTSTTALDNYALAWGITYYLAKKKPKELATYLKILQAKTSESDDNETIRITDFESVFGNNWDVFERDFRNFISRQ